MQAFFNICCFVEWNNVKKKGCFIFLEKKTHHICTNILIELLKPFSFTKIPPSLIRNYQLMVITKKAKQFSKFLCFLLKLLLHTFECNAS